VTCSLPPALLSHRRLGATVSAVITAAALASVIGRAQAPTFSSRVESVRVDVLVTDKGTPVRGLQAQDFEIADNGVPQQIDLVSFEQIPLNVVFALDASGSVEGDRLTRLRRAAGAVLDQLHADDQAALVTFSHVVRRDAPLTHDLFTVRDALDSVQADGETSVIDGAYAGVLVGESDVGRSLLIIFSDGTDTTSWLPSANVLDIARRSDVVAYALAVRSASKPRFLDDLTGLTGGELFEVERTANLEEIFLKVLEQFRQRYLVSYTPRGVARDGWHRLDVRVKGRRSVKARPGYLAGPSSTTNGTAP
jgi:VWFA-related protein